MENLKGLATGIGSLPHKDADAALDLIFKCCPEIPFWPQLPKRDIREGMIAQFSENLPCLKVTPAGLTFNAENKEAELENFYEQVINNNVEHFRISEDFAQGLYAFKKRLDKADAAKIKYIKCHITGPFTFAASIKDDKGALLLHDPVFMQAIIKGLAMKALWQIEFLKGFGKKIIVFVDEPYLGCFGSAFTPLNKEDALNGLKEFTEQIKFGDALMGVHCCGNTDWSIFTDTAGIDIINFDTFAFLERFLLYAADLKGFLKREGIICWGIVPTQEFTGQETADLLLKKIESGIGSFVEKGLERRLLLENLLISPACGLGALDTSNAEKILKLLSQASSLIKNTLK